MHCLQIRSLEFRSLYTEMIVLPHGNSDTQLRLAVITIESASKLFLQANSTIGSHEPVAISAFAEFFV